MACALSTTRCTRPSSAIATRRAASHEEPCHASGPAHRRTSAISARRAHLPGEDDRARPHLHLRSGTWHPAQQSRIRHPHHADPRHAAGGARGVARSRGLRAGRKQHGGTRPLRRGRTAQRVLSRGGEAAGVGHRRQPCRGVRPHDPPPHARRGGPHTGLSSAAGGAHPWRLHRDVGPATRARPDGRGGRGHCCAAASPS